METVLEPTELSVKGVYLLHFERKLKHAGHYIGYSSNIGKRYKQHCKGTVPASPKEKTHFMEIINSLGIQFRVVRIWPGADYAFEKQLKKRKCSPKLCPICNPKAGTRTKERTTDDRTE